MTSRWPEMMLKKDAAEYCSLSIAAFEREVFLRRLPPPVLFGGRNHWRKTAIDRALDIITGENAAHGNEAPYRRKMRERHARQDTA